MSPSFSLKKMGDKQHVPESSVLKKYQWNKSNLLDIQTKHVYISQQTLLQRKIRAQEQV